MKKCRKPAEWLLRRNQRVMQRGGETAEVKDTVGDRK